MNIKWLGKCPRCHELGYNAWSFTTAETERRHEKQKPTFVSDDDIAEQRLILGIGRDGPRVLAEASPFGLGNPPRRRSPGSAKTTLCFEIASKMVGLG